MVLAVKHLGEVLMTAVDETDDVFPSWETSPSAHIDLKDGTGRVVEAHGDESGLRPHSYNSTASDLYR